VIPFSALTTISNDVVPRRQRGFNVWTDAYDEIPVKVVSYYVALEGGVDIFGL